MKDIFDFEEFMMTELFDVFPYIENDKVIIRKMDMNDVAAVSYTHLDVYKRQGY